MRNLHRVQEDQNSTHTSYVGGKPSLPAGMDIPRCERSSSEQTFFFQVAFPEGTSWAGRTLACFACTCEVDAETLIPPMLSNHKQGCDIPEGFLTSYERNFAFVVFPTAEGRIVSDYAEKLRFAALEFGETADFATVGGHASWLLEDESPATYAGSTEMDFLLQLPPGLTFETVPGAAPQMELDLMGEAAESPLPYYQLFLGNAIYLFGTRSGDPLVYAITQI